MLDHEQSWIGFCDGACSHNPGPGGWGVVLKSPKNQVFELGGKAQFTTNNRMELMAALAAMRWPLKVSQEISPTPTLYLHTDSLYVCQGMKGGLEKWETKRQEIPNHDLWKKLKSAADMLSIHWIHIRGHQGIPANERVDEIARLFSKQKPASLFCGSLSDYPLTLKVYPST